MNKLGNYLREKYSTIIGWGISGYYEKHGKKLEEFLDYLIDRDVAKQGTKLNNKKVCSINKLKDESPQNTLIVIFSTFYKEIASEIEGYGEFSVIQGELLEEIVDEIVLEKFFDEPEGVRCSISIATYDFTTNSNGASKFIIEQMRGFNEKKIVHMHMYLSRDKYKFEETSLITILKNGKKQGIILSDKIFDRIIPLHSIIIQDIVSAHYLFIEKFLGNIDITIPVLYYIHDFACICANIFLTYNDEVYCNIDDYDRCKLCKYGVDKEKILKFHKELFMRENLNIVCPSQRARSIIEAVFKDIKLKIQVVPHETYEVVPNRRINNKIIRIGFVGLACKIKGWEVFEKISIQYKDKYEFYLMGSCEKDISDSNITIVDVSIIKNGNDAMIRAIVEYNLDIVLLWPIWPETYSYTYYESYAAGAWVITNDMSGNICDQVYINRNGVVLHSTSELENLLDETDKLMKMLEKNTHKISNVKFNKKIIEQLS